MKQEQMHVEIRRLQRLRADKPSYTLGIPVQYIRQLSLKHGDYMIMKIVDNKLVIEKAKI